MLITDDKARKLAEALEKTAHELYQDATDLKVYAILKGLAHGINPDVSTMHDTENIAYGTGIKMAQEIQKTG